MIVMNFLFSISFQFRKDFQSQNLIGKLNQKERLENHEIRDKLLNVSLNQNGKIFEKIIISLLNLLKNAKVSLLNLSLIQMLKLTMCIVMLVLPLFIRIIDVTIIWLFSKQAIPKKLLLFQTM
jgi:hypothetical protein